MTLSTLLVAPPPVAAPCVHTHLQHAAADPFGDQHQLRHGRQVGEAVKVHQLVELGGVVLVDRWVGVWVGVGVGVWVGVGGFGRSVSDSRAAWEGREGILAEGLPKWVRAIPTNIGDALWLLCCYLPEC